MDELRTLEEKTVEQTHKNPLQETQDSPQDKAEGASYGKFKTKDGLLEAYNSLEAEFTRRSQRIKELEALVNTRVTEEKWEKKVSELTEKYPIAKHLTAEIGEYIAQKKELIEDDNCLEKALLAVISAKYATKDPLQDADNKTFETNANTLLRDKVEAELKEVKESVPKILPPGGELPAAPRISPKSVREAGDLARKLLKTQ